MLLTNRRITMAIAYKKLFKLLIDKDLKKKDLCELANISSTTVSKLAKNENVTVDVLAKICRALNCGFDDVVEIIETTEGE